MIDLELIKFVLGVIVAQIPVWLMMARQQRRMDAEAEKLASETKKIAEESKQVAAETAAIWAKLFDETQRGVIASLKSEVERLESDKAEALQNGQEVGERLQNCKHEKEVLLDERTKAIGATNALMGEIAMLRMVLNHEELRDERSDQK